MVYLLVPAVIDKISIFHQISPNFTYSQKKKTKQNKTKQSKTKQNKTKDKQTKTKQNKTKKKPNKTASLKVQLLTDRPTASTLSILWQGHEGNVLFHVWQLWAL